MYLDSIRSVPIAEVEKRIRRTRLGGTRLTKRLKNGGGKSYSTFTALLANQLTPGQASVKTLVDETTLYRALHRWGAIWQEYHNQSIPLFR